MSVVDVKTCSACGEAKPVSAFRARHGWDNRRCRDCDNASNRAYRRRKAGGVLRLDAYRARLAAGHRVCPDCQTEFPVAEFLRGSTSASAQKFEGTHAYCRACNRTRRRRERTANLETFRERGRRRWQANKPRSRAQNLASYHRTRVRVLRHYSGGDPTCACCGDRTLAFLEIDHVNGGGNQHRQTLAGQHLSGWLWRHGLPPGFQVLCANCNAGKARLGECPHQTEIRSVGGAA